MRQKSLMSWLGNNTDHGTDRTSKTVSTPHVNAVQSSALHATHTPQSKPPSTVVLNSSTQHSSKSSEAGNFNDTPLTSETVDVDVLFKDGEEAEGQPLRPVRMIYL